MEKLTHIFDVAWRAVIQPHQFAYNINTTLPIQTTLNGVKLQRIDMEIFNDQGKKISAMIVKKKNGKIKQSVLYLHGNGGSKIEAKNLLCLVAEKDMALIAFDYIGCGNSDKGYLTYGQKEVGDAQLVLRQAYRHIDVSSKKIIIWGRSMGAVIALMFSAKNHEIVEKIVLDSPFRCLEGVIKRGIYEQTGMPGLLVNATFYFLKKQIEQKLNYALFSQDYLSYLSKLPKNIAVLFICSRNDKIVPKKEVQELYKSYEGCRQILEINESHQQDRGQEVIAQVMSWLCKQKITKNQKLKLTRSLGEIEQVPSFC